MLLPRSLRADVDSVAFRTPAESLSLFSAITSLLGRSFFQELLQSVANLIMPPGLLCVITHCCISTTTAERCCNLVRGLRRDTANVLSDRMCTYLAEVSGVDWNLISKEAFASSSWDGTVKLWQLGAPKSSCTLTRHGQHAVYGERWLLANSHFPVYCERYRRRVTGIARFDLRRRRDSKYNTRKRPGV